MITNSIYGVSLLMLCINPMYVCTHPHTYPHPHRPTAPPPPLLTITDHSRCQHRYLLVTQFTHSNDVEHLRHKLVSLVLLHHLRTRTGFRLLGVADTNLEGRGGEGRGGVEEWRSWWGDKIQMLYELCTYSHSQGTINGGLAQFFTLHLLRVSQDCLNTHHAQCRFTEGTLCAASRSLLGGWVLWTVAALYSDLIREGQPR